MPFTRNFHFALSATTVYRQFPLLTFSAFVPEPKKLTRPAELIDRRGPDYPSRHAPAWPGAPVSLNWRYGHLCSCAGRFFAQESGQQRLVELNRCLPERTCGDKFTQRFVEGRCSFEDEPCQYRPHPSFRESGSGRMAPVPPSDPLEARTSLRHPADRPSHVLCPQLPGRDSTTTYKERRYQHQAASFRVRVWPVAVWPAPSEHPGPRENSRSRRAQHQKCYADSERFRQGCHQAELCLRSCRRRCCP
jgi:hypothetical protein